MQLEGYDNLLSYMKFIERNKISSEQLQLLIKFSEEEILRLLEQKEKENKNHEKEVTI